MDRLLPYKKASEFETWFILKNQSLSNLFINEKRKIGN